MTLPLTPAPPSTGMAMGRGSYPIAIPFGSDTRYKPPITQTYKCKCIKKTAQHVALWMQPTNYWAKRPTKPNNLIFRICFMYFVIFCYFVSLFGLGIKFLFFTQSFFPCKLNKILGTLFKNLRFSFVGQLFDQ